MVHAPAARVLPKSASDDCVHALNVFVNDTLHHAGLATPVDLEVADLGWELMGATKIQDLNTDSYKFLRHRNLGALS